MSYKVSGITTENSRIIVIDKGTWSVETTTSGSIGNFEVTGLGVGRKIVFARNDLGKIDGLGNIFAIPAINKLEVGSGKQYTNLQDAIDASEYGDIIYLYPGSYTSQQYDAAGKFFHIRGIGDPGQVYFNGTSGFNLTNMSFNDTMYIENITGNIVGNNWAPGFSLSSIGAGATVVVNKCRGIASSENSYGGNITSNAGSVLIRQGHFTKWYRTFAYVDGYVEITKTYCYYGFSTYMGWPDVLDVVSSATTGYGPNYGDFYIDEP